MFFIDYYLRCSYENPSSWNLLKSIGDSWLVIANRELNQVYRAR